MDYYRWSHEKNQMLKAGRGTSFEQVVMHIEHGEVLDVLQHPNQSTSPHQQILVVEINHYAYLVQSVKDKNGKF